MTCQQLKKAEVHGHTIAYVDKGRGLPILFVHGFPLDHSMWRYQLEALGDQFRVLAPDLPGFGASSGLSTTVMRMEDFADVLAGLLDTLEVTEPVVYCGLSMGGYIAWQFWRRHGHRLRGLILCDTRAAADAPDVAEQRRVNAERVLREGPGFFVDMMLSRLFSAGFLSKSGPVLDEMRRTMMSTPPETIAAVLRGMAERADARQWLGEIRLPCLLVVGEDDILSPPSEMEAMATALPESKLVVIPEAGHLAPLENPEAVSAAIRDFLSQL